MKKDPIMALLVAALFIAVFATAGLSFWYVQLTRQIGRLQAHASQLNQQSKVMQALAAESLEFSRRHPAIDPVLESIGLKSPAGRTNPPAARPTR